MQTLKLLSYNIQASIPMDGPHHYVSRSWRHFLPHQARLHNLRAIADVVSEYDVVGLQEVDAGSMRSSFVNQVEFLAKHSGFYCWENQVNRDLKLYAQHANGMLSRYAIHHYEKHRLPSLLPGRGVMTFCLGEESNPILFAVAHLSLTKTTQQAQLAFLAQLVKGYEHVVLMGDFNVEPAGLREKLLEPTGLQVHSDHSKTYPSWKPVKKLDYILTSPSLQVQNYEVLEVPFSDHLPVAMEIILPEDVQIKT